MPVLVVAVETFGRLLGCEPGRVLSGARQKHTHRHTISLIVAGHLAAGGSRRSTLAPEQRRSTLRHLRHSASGVLGRDRGVYAAFVSICANCATRIVKGSPIRYDAGAGKFVHRECARHHGAVTVRARPPAAPATAGIIPHGLKRKTIESYTTEWTRYTTFAQRQGYRDIPGKDQPWDMGLLWRYMSFRGSSCKPPTVTSGLSALAHFGARCNQLLATSKHDNDSVMYRQIAMLKHQLAIDYHARCGGGSCMARTGARH